MRTVVSILSSLFSLFQCGHSGVKDLSVRGEAGGPFYCAGVIGVVARGSAAALLAIVTVS